jgi:alkaline phosphatase D
MSQSLTLPNAGWTAKASTRRGVPSCNVSCGVHSVWESVLGFVSHFGGRISGLALVFLAVLLCALPAGAADRIISRIAFGSCLNTNAHPMLDRTLQIPFDLFVFLGDNVYADTTNQLVMERKYNALKQSPFFQGLLRKAPILGTWDDHDYGWNDAGAEYPMKVEAQELFLNFFDVPADSPRRKQEGIYHAELFGPEGKRVQVILLDTRYFRSPLLKGVNTFVPRGGDYVPNPDRSTTILGEAQWNWLEEQLRVPAEVRIIASSIQFISEFSGAEAWANMPHEKERFLELLRKTRARGVVFISGDRHWAELSRMDGALDYPLYDVTSSAMTQKHPRGTPTPNIYRAHPVTYHDANVGLITIAWEQRGQLPFLGLKLQVLDVDGNARISREVMLPR